MKHKLSPKYGKVSLVGAGPGDPELLTIKAYRLLQDAEVVLYDSLISAGILECIGKNALLIHVGKRAKHHIASQDEINQKLVRYSKQGKNVVRLKGGDPFIFGRGGEELEYMAEHGISFEVVPGITAASGCASYAGIPLTHRDFSQSVHLVTAQQKDKSSVDWKRLAGEKQTLVFYMGVLRNELISNSLISHGLNPNTPVAVIENGTYQNQRCFSSTIAKLSELVEKNQIKMPALIIVGEVVKLSKQLSWFNPVENDESLTQIYA